MAALKRNNPLFYRSAPMLWRMKRMLSIPLFKTVRSVSFQKRLPDAGNRKLPDFLIIGAMKCGTGSLYRTLIQHPQVAAPLKKEIYYFNNPQYRQHDVRWYKAHFAKSNSGLLAFEASPSYLSYPYIPERVKELIPGAKFIVMLRNPVDRALSHYWHHFRPRRETLSFEEAIEKEPERMGNEWEMIQQDETFVDSVYAGFAYLKRGCYAEQLKPWFDAFPKERFLIIQSEQYYRESDNSYRETLEFLGLDDFTPKGFKKIIYPSYEKMSQDTRNMLARHFEPYNKELYNLIGKEYDWDK